jgi:hypothetical protein
MHITDAERLLIIQKREELRIVSQEIVDLTDKEILSAQDFVDIKKKFIHILSLVSILTTYMNSNILLDALRHRIMITFDFLDFYSMANQIQQKKTRASIQAICAIVNTIQFSYSPWPSRFLAIIYPLGSLDIQK